MTQAELQIYNTASAAVVIGNRRELALSLRAARLYDKANYTLNQGYYGLYTLTGRIMDHANYVGWPIRIRPNGRYL